MVVLPLVAGGCLSSDAVECSAWSCPTGTACDEANGGCVRPDQIGACEGIADLQPCEIAGEPGGICRKENCVEPRCGDGLKTGNELCDPGDPGSAVVTCRSRDFYAGTDAVCTPACDYDVSDCDDRCGDGEINGDEECDGDELGGVTCAMRGYNDPAPAGTLACTSACRFDEDDCTGFCGDTRVRDPEVCDGAPPDETCVDAGYDRGFLDCHPLLCAPDPSTCAFIGWQRVSSDFEIAGLVAATFSAGGDAWAAYQADGSAAVHRFDGATWSRIERWPDTYVHDLWASGPDDLYVAGARAKKGVVLHFDGDSWSDALANLDDDVTGLWGAPGGDLVALSHTEAQVRSGGVWTPVADPDLEYPLRAWGPSADDLTILVTTGGTVLPGHLVHFDGTGAVPIAGAPDGVHAIGGEGQPIAVGTSGVHRRNGADWYDQGWPVSQTPVAIWAQSPDVFYVLGRDLTFPNDDPDVILRHDEEDGWTTMGELPVQPVHDVRALAGVGPAAGDLLALGEPQLALRYSGSHFTDLAAPVTMFWLWAAGPDTLLAMGEDTVLYLYDGAQWTPVDEGDQGDPPLRYRVFPQPVAGDRGAGEIYALAWRDSVPEEHYIVQYDDGAWSTVPVPAFLNAVDAAGEGRAVAVGAGGLVMAREEGVWLVARPAIEGAPDLWRVSCRASGECFASYNDGGMLHRAAGEPEWVAFPAPSQEQVDALLAIEGGDLVASTADGDVWRWDGDQWLAIEEISQIHNLHASSPDDLFAMSVNGLWRWDGAHWSPVRSDEVGDLVAHMDGAGSTLFLTGFDGVARLDRLDPW